MIATRLGARAPIARSLQRHIAGPQIQRFQLPSDSRLLQRAATQLSPAVVTTSHYQRRCQGTSSNGPNSSENSKPNPYASLSIPQILLRSFLGSVRNLGNTFRSETLRKTYKTNPIELVLALSVLATLGVISGYAIYIYFNYFYGEHFTRYPDEVAAALRKALFYTNIDPDPQRALKYYKQALALCDELHIDPFTDEVIGIRLQISHWLQKIDNQPNAVQVLEHLLGDCKRWIEVAEKAIEEGTVPPSLLPPSNLKEDKAESSKDVETKAPETVWGKRNRLLQKAIGISIKLGELYNDEHVLKPEAALERVLWGVQTSAKETRRRAKEGTKPGEGPWMTAEQMGAAIESLAHSYEVLNRFELALPLFFEALNVCSDPCHSAVLMNNIAACYAQHTVVRPGIAEIENAVMEEKAASATPAERRASYLEAARRWASNASKHASEPKGEARTGECDEACAVSLCTLGDIASLSGKPAEARRMFEQAITMSKKFDFAPGVAQAEEGLRRLSNSSS